MSRYTKDDIFRMVEEEDVEGLILKDTSAEEEKEKRQGYLIVEF